MTTSLVTLGLFWLGLAALGVWANALMLAKIAEIMKGRKP